MKQDSMWNIVAKCAAFMVTPNHCQITHIHQSHYLQISDTLPLQTVSCLAWNKADIM